MAALGRFLQNRPGALHTEATSAIKALTCYLAPFTCCKNIRQAVSQFLRHILSKYN